MAYKRTYRKKRAVVNKKKTYARRVRRHAFRRRIPRGVSTLANIPRIQHLRYCDGVTLTGTAGAQALYKFRANSLYDPDLTGTGHQPMRFDQMATFYARYTVIGAKITCKYVGIYNNVSTMPAAYFCLYLDDDGTPPSSMKDMIESGRSKWRILNSSDKDRFTVSAKFSAKKFFGVANISDNDQLGATTSSNPANEAIFCMALQALDGSSSVAASFIVTIDYLALFDEAIDVASS